MAIEKDPPAPDDVLTARQRQRLLEHIRARWKQPECVLCGENRWAVVEGIFVIHSSPLRGFRLGGSKVSLPTGAVVCLVCGHTELINLVVADVFIDDAPGGGNDDE